MHQHAQGHRHPAGEDTRQEQDHRGQGDDDVLTHHPSGPAGQADGFRQLQQVVLHQGDVRGLHGHVRAGRTHRHTDVGGGERRGVVDPVADHGHDLAGALQLLDDRELVLGQQGGVDPVDTGGLGDSLRHQPGVAGEHHDMVHPGLVEAGDHLGGVLADPVGDRDDSDDGAVHAHDHRGLPGSGQ